MNDVEERAVRFVAQLRSLREDRGAMADLRRGFSDSTAHRSWPYLGSWCDLTSDRQRTIHQTVAAAFATVPDPERSVSVPEALRHLATGEGRGDEGLKSFEGRFRRFLSCNSYRDVCTRLPGVVRACAAKGIALDHVSLFRDLWYWGNRVKLRWANTYWGGERSGGEG